MTCCECCFDTPQSIIDKGNDHYPAGTDIFEEIFEKAGSDLTYEELMKVALWATYRYRMIGSCDTPEWVQAVADRLDLVGPRWDAIIDATDGLDLADLKELHFVRTIQRTKIDGTEGDVRTLKRTAITGTEGDVRTLIREGTDTNVNSKTGEDVVLTEDESLPQTATDATQYLDRRTKVTTTPEVETTDELTHDTTDTEKYAPNTQDQESYAPNNQDTETYDEERDLAAVTFVRMMDAYPNLMMRFCDEFEAYFMVLV